MCFDDFSFEPSDDTPSGEENSQDSPPVLYAIVPGILVIAGMLYIFFPYQYNSYIHPLERENLHVGDIVEFVENSFQNDVKGYKAVIIDKKVMPESKWAKFRRRTYLLRFESQKEIRYDWHEVEGFVKVHKRNNTEQFRRPLLFNETQLPGITILEFEFR